MKNGSGRILLFWMTWAALLFPCPTAAAAPAAIDQKLYSELLKFPTDRKIVYVDGVPCLKIFIPRGQSISYFCRFVEYFDRNFKFFRQRIALINRLEPMAVFGGTDSLSTDLTFIYVPLNFSIRPKILPERIENISHMAKFILIDLGEQCLGLYQYGKLIELFPISSGRDNRTPAKKFTVLSKEIDHYSKKYNDAWMPYSLRLFGDIFLHGGILPSYAASHGCIRLIYQNAVFIFNWAEIGTPGEIVNQNQTAFRQKEELPVEEEPSIKTLYY